MKKSTSDLPFEVVHITELVDEALGKGELQFKGKLDMKLAWHDPCNLGHMSEPYTHWEGDRGQWGCLEPSEGFEAKQFNRGTAGTYEPPRNILAAMEGWRCWSSSGTTSSPGAAAVTAGCPRPTPTWRPTRWTRGWRRPRPWEPRPW